jgi:hemerythrin-like domain-containing protein
MSASDLDLASRTGLPESIAYLRRRFPAAEWRASPRYGQLARRWQHVHEGLRGEGGSLQVLTEAFANGQRPPEAFRREFTTLLGSHLNHLQLHHQMEDQFYFPRFRSLDERMVAGFDLLERDHEQIHHQLEQSAMAATRLLESLNSDREAQKVSTESFAARAAKLLALLDRHLSDEEDLVIPALLEHGEEPFD